ncbi:MAG: spore maturation protein [Deltaproteobacteria bacterium]|nr:MAG: spore maturation protein [Deltaproteobacteria bacterium]
MVEHLSRVSAAVGTWAIPLLVAGILLHAALRRVKIYEVFVQGAKEGFEIAVRIIPYLVAILVAVGIFRASGALGWVEEALAPLLAALGIPVEALPMMLVRPLSGSGATGIVAETLASAGPDSLAGRMVSVMAGSTETTFYVLAVYFGAVGVTRVRHTLAAALIADAAGLGAAIVFTRLFFG